MLAKQFRLPATVRVQSKRSYHSPYFTLKVIPNTLSVSRFGFVVSKKTAKLATKRNLAKRLLRSCVEELLTEIHPGYDLLFILRSTTMQRLELQEAVGKALRHYQLLS